MMSIRCLSGVLCCAVASVVFTAAAAEPRSAPGAFAVSAKAEAVVMPLLPDTAPTREIRLAPPLSNEPHAMSKSDIVVDKNRPLRIGYDRLPAAADRRIALARLPWQALSDGSLAARVAVTSPTAAGVRLHIGLSGVAGVIAARFKSTQDSGRVYFADTGALTGAAGYWSPVLEGDTAIVEFSLPPGAVPQGDLTVQSVGHLLITAATAKTLQDIGHADACEHDVACVEDPLSSLHRAASSVAETVVSDGGFIVLCTATLLNTVPQTGIPYLMTAYHCYDEDHVRTEQEVQDVASSMTTWWFFDATACGSNVPGPYQQVAGGATLVYRGLEIDFVLFRLNTSPPAGAWFSAWDATPVPSGTSALVLHHPEGDLKKLSSGNTLGYTTFNGLGSYIEMGYGYGSTEAGSSGSPLLTCRRSGLRWELQRLRGARRLAGRHRRMRRSVGNGRVFEIGSCVSVRGEISRASRGSAVRERRRRRVLQRRPRSLLHYGRWRRTDQRRQRQRGTWLVSNRRFVQYPRHRQRVRCPRLPFLRLRFTWAQ